MLTREHIVSGDFIQSVDCLPEYPCLSPDQLSESMYRTLSERPSNDPIWVFGYGSLMWNPLFEYETSEVAVIEKWHRSFCINLLVGRGSREIPGRMLALKPGGQVTGIAFQIESKKTISELSVLWSREMAGGFYRASWLPGKLRDGRQASMLTFTAVESHPLFLSESDPRITAKAIANASGVMGSNLEYFKELERFLGAQSIVDKNIDELTAEVQILL